MNNSVQKLCQWGLLLFTCTEAGQQYVMLHFPSKKLKTNLHSNYFPSDLITTRLIAPKCHGTSQTWLLFFEQCSNSNQKQEGLQVTALGVCSCVSEGNGQPAAFLTEGLGNSHKPHLGTNFLSNLTFKRCHSIPRRRQFFLTSGRFLYHPSFTTQNVSIL